MDAVALSLLWPDPKAREFHCGGVIACVSLLKGIYIGVLEKLSHLLQIRRCLVLGFILPGNAELVLVSTGVACIAYSNGTSLRLLLPFPMFLVYI